MLISAKKSTKISPARYGITSAFLAVVPISAAVATAVSVFAVAAVAAAVAVAVAAEPDLKTPAPVIYLADNLDEKDNLGWCIDTVGRGLSDRLHAHSCKPRGGDVQFRFDGKTGQIQSATFDGKCAQLLNAAGNGVNMGLLDCGGKGQAFTFDADSGEFRPKFDASLCLVVGANGRSAGPFMSRDLKLESCASTDPKFKRWVISAAN
ncbi:MAG: ricin-type beta-trefoil lectin domain protein [Rhizobiaceae bacterium]